MTQSLTHDDIRRTIMCVLGTGEVVASQDNFVTFHTVFTPNTVRSEYRHVLAGAPLLYSVLDDTEKTLIELVALLEAAPGMEAIAHITVGLVGNLKQTKDIVIDGLPAVAARQTGTPQPPVKKSNFLDFFRKNGVDRPKPSS